jgi:molybdopterin-containing oxidoreductase family iron-sulfur binding subunit
MAAGFGFAGAVLAGCQRAPLQEAIPPLTQPDDVVAGQPYWYASTCGACPAGCGMLVKTRDGRPIKLEGNPDHPVSKGGLCAAGQASLLGLYDGMRLQHPLQKGQKAGWDEIDRGIRSQLDTIRRQGGAVRLLSGTITSPTAAVLVQRFLGGFRDARWVVYDPVSCSAILDAHKQTHGMRVLPRYHFERADVILSFEADFLGPWISPVEFTAGYRARRMLNGSPPHSSYHVQVESRLSLTSSKADERACLAPAEIGGAIHGLAIRLDQLARKAGVRLGPIDPGPAAKHLTADLAARCDRWAERLWQARGRSLVLSGSQDVEAQVVCNYINHLLDNYKPHPASRASAVGLGASPLGTGPLSTAAGLVAGTTDYGPTLDIEHPSGQRQGSDRDLEGLLAEIYAHKVAALFIVGSNPVYDLPDGDLLGQALRRLPLVVCCTERLDETARMAKYVCPQPHYLESWDDAEPVSGLISLRQPTIPRLGNTRPVMESLAAWTGKVKSAYDLIRERWQADVLPRQAKEQNFTAFWERAVEAGIAEVTPVREQPTPFDSAPVQRALRRSRPADDAMELVLYPKVGMPDGSHAYNPWLQELPDPITKATWDNYACLSPATAAGLSVGEGDVVRLEVPGGGGRPQSLELPVLVQRGQHDRVVALALGYGSLLSSRFAGIGPAWLQARPTVGANGLVGQNAAPLLAWERGSLRHARPGVKLTSTGAKHPLAVTQRYDTLTVPRRLAPPGQERRPIIQETTLAVLAKSQPNQTHKHLDLWPDDHPYPERRWGMVIDLHACTGCSACVIACQAENNVPVVGKDEVRRQREMHWIRIDRYYSGPAEVNVAHQPMLCQHCERAPCETVCPVLATTHSAEGLNEQVYNRCVGTRYCANNCPYKVRRFNWFEYAREDSLQNLALNPDVTVRSRGVMEKCSFCVQRLQEAKIEAKSRGEEFRDGEIQTACQQSCPAQAIVFGDVNDPTSRVNRLRHDPRHYQVLAELNIRPAVGYLKVIRPAPR